MALVTCDPALILGTSCAQGKHLVAVAAAKRHTLVMTVDGDVYTWGHRAVAPRRVALAGARDAARAAGGAGLLFHKGQAEVALPRAAQIAAGAAHSSVLTLVRPCVNHLTST